MYRASFLWRHVEWDTGSFHQFSFLWLSSLYHGSCIIEKVSRTCLPRNREIMAKYADIAFANSEKARTFYHFSSKEYPLSTTRCPK
ncbi:uncharacterized protein LOC107871837 [Capsicum annuum]|uniref:uncharacterized protein LOC107871837 n=1 Tax=Capsicum annuum TaxID=4072 RepID=UPI001FB053D2|nr:uncharacterized protein LOC107871837 [Capsicum annuum]